MDCFYGTKPQEGFLEMYINAGQCLRNLALLVASSGNKAEASRIAEEAMMTLQQTSNKSAAEEAAVQMVQYSMESMLQPPPPPRQ